MNEGKRLLRSRDDKMISGVCAGIADYLQIDPTIVRLVAVVLLVMGNFATLVVYIAMAVLLPEEGDIVDVPAAADDAATPTPEYGPAPAGYEAPAQEYSPPEQYAPATENYRETAAHYGRSTATTFALILIAVGGLILAPRFLPGLDWWRLWPLIIVGAGVVQAITPGRDGWTVHRVFDGLSTAMVGFVFLAVTVGVVSWAVWWQVLHLWPVLLIAIGLEILGKSLKTSWPRVLGSLLVIAALAFAVASQAGRVEQFSLAGPGQSRTVSATEPVGSVREASLKITGGLANITINEGDDLISVDGTTPFGEPRLEVERRGPRAEAELTLGESAGTVDLWPRDIESRMFVRLSDDVVWDLEVETGLAAARADLSRVPVRSVVFKPGMADCDIRLGDVPDRLRRAEARVESGVSSVKLRIPRGAEVRLESKGGLQNTRVNRELESLGNGVWETPGFSAAERAGRPVWLVSAETGVGSFELDRY